MDTSRTRTARHYRRRRSKATMTGFFDTMPHPGLAVALAATSFMSELVFAVTSFGPAVVLNVGWQICFMLQLGNGTMCVRGQPGTAASWVQVCARYVGARARG